MVSYINLMNRFWQVDRQLRCLSGNETRLYFYLLKVANENRPAWPETLLLGDKEIIQECGLARGTIRECRLRLTEVGFIDFEEGGHGQGSKYKYWLRYQNLTPKDADFRGQILTAKEKIRCQKLEPKVSNFDTKSYIRDLEDFPKEKKEGSESGISDVEFEEINPSSTPGSGTPPSSPEPEDPPDQAEADDQERIEFTAKLQKSRRVIESLSSLHKLKGQDALDWIERFVTAQWAADKLKDRRNSDLITHCLNWIEGKLLKHQESEQRSGTRNPKQTDNSAGQKGTGFASGTSKQTGFIPPGGLRRSGSSARDEDH